MGPEDSWVAVTVLHVVVFIIIATFCLVGAKGFCEIFDIFNYRCVLYAKVSTKLTDIEYKNATTSVDEEITPEIQPLHVLLNLGIFDDDYLIEMGYDPRKEKFNRTFDPDNAEPIPGVVDGYISNDEIWISNSTLTAKAHVVMTATVFAAVMMCNFVIFTPFLGTVVSAVFALIVVLFSRTGKIIWTESVPAAWIYVYPLLVATSFMAILSIIAFILVNNGLNTFLCPICTSDWTNAEQKLGRRLLFHNIRISQVNYFMAAIFWVIQLLIVFTRLISAADFQMTSVLIKKQTVYETDEEDDEAVELFGYTESATVETSVDDFKKEHKEE